MQVVIWALLVVCLPLTIAVIGYGLYLAQGSATSSRPTGDATTAVSR